MDSPSECEASNTTLIAQQSPNMAKKIINKKTQSTTTKISAPVAITSIQRPKAPKFGMRSGTVHISHKEYVGTVSNNTSGFSLLGVSAYTPGYDLNPGCGALFPWLSGIARLYEKYKFTRVVFSLVSSTPTSQSGKVYMAIDYDYDDDVASSKMNFLTNHSVVQTSVWADSSLAVDCKLMNQNMDWRYTVAAAYRSGAVEPRTTYGGFLMIASDGLSGNSSWDLWVEYDVDLSIERLDENFLASAASDVAAPITTNVTAPNTTPWSSTPINVPTTMRVLARGNPLFPALATTISNAQWLLDITTLGLNTVTIVTRLRNGATSEATYLIEDTAPKTLVAVNSTGAVVQSFSVDTIGAYHTGTTGKDSSDPTLEGSFARVIGSINIPALMAAFPTAKYLLMQCAITTAGYAVDYIQSQVFCNLD